MPHQILVVDDDSAVRTIARRLLERWGFHVHEAGNVDEALAIASVTHLDIVLTDYAMPGATGGTLARALRDRGAAMPVLFMSGYGSDLGEQDIADTDVIAKPFAQRELLRRVVERLARPLTPTNVP